METLKYRKDVDPALTWDTSLIYKDTETMLEDEAAVKKLADEICLEFEGKLKSASDINACLRKYETYLIKVDHLDNYTSINVEVDYYNNENRDLASRISNTIAETRSKLSFIETEISAMDGEVIHEAAERVSGQKVFLEDIIAKKAHLLHPEAEKAVAALGQLINSPYEIYNNIKLADMKFEPFEAGGKTYPLGYSLYEDSYEYEPNTEVRRKAFEGFYSKLMQYENSTAAAFNAHVQKEKVMAALRGFSSIEEMNLFEDKVTSEMYNRQIDLITEKLAPHMRKLARLLKRIYGLDRMTSAYLKLQVDPDYSPKVSIEEAWEMIRDGLSVMGEDYISMIDEARRDRWVDFARNQGKCTGGFCASPYQKPSFILLSWNDLMADVSTLAHELGHAGHFRLCSQAQSIYDTKVSTYIVEAPSTINEIIMARFMLKKSTDARFRRWVLAGMVSNTYYHNFVTHLLEGAYQREAYKIVEEGGSLQAETLSGIYRKVLEKFWGDDVDVIPGAELIWMRQPHYYMGLYSYSYSAGLTVATQMAKRIENEGAAAVKDWKKVLESGSTLTPMEMARLGGIDISTDAPLLDTIETIGQYIDEICSLTAEIEGWSEPV